MLFGFIIVIRVAICLDSHNRLLRDVIDDEKVKVSTVMGDILALILVKKRPVLDYIAHGGMTQNAEVAKIRIFSQNVLEQ